MKKGKIVLLFIVSIIGAVTGYVLTNSTHFKFCTEIQYNCRDLYNNIGDPLFYGMTALAIVFLILIFRPTAVSIWKKFAKWYIPITTLIFIFYSNPSSGDFFSPYPEQVFQWLSAIYVVVSVLIIALKRTPTLNNPKIRD